MNPLNSQMFNAASVIDQRELKFPGCDGEVSVFSRILTLLTRKIHSSECEGMSSEEVRKL